MSATRLSIRASGLSENESDALDLEHRRSSAGPGECWSGALAAAQSFVAPGRGVSFGPGAVSRLWCSAFLSLSRCLIRSPGSAVVTAPVTGWPPRSRAAWLTGCSCPKASGRPAIQPRLRTRGFYEDASLKHPGRHVLGTDILGNDVLYRTLKGVRVALLIGGLTSLIVIPIALFFGVLGGVFRRPDRRRLCFS